MVCIIDDREDVWSFAPNLVTVKPYICFRDTGDINAPEKSVSDLFVNDMVESSDRTPAFRHSTKVDEMIAFECETDYKSSGEEIAKIESVDQNNPKTEKNDESSDTNGGKTAVKTDETTVKIDETTVKTDETILKSDETIVKSDETIVKTDETTVKTDETTVKTDETIVKTDETTVKTGETIVESDETSNEKIEKTNEKNDEIEENNVEPKETNDAKASETNERIIKEINETNDEKISTTDTSKEISKEDAQKNEVLSEKNTEIQSHKEGAEENAEQIESNAKPKDIIEDNDDYLLYLEEILTHIHSEYYKEYDEKMKYKSEEEEIKIPDLKEIVPRVRKCVLRGVNIVFSGVIPTNMPPEKHKLYNIAKNFGATVTTEIVVEGSPKTTHLIAAKWGTAKVNKCIKLRNISIVSPTWLYSCAERWERVDERLYPLDKEDFSAEKDKQLVKQVPESNVKNQIVNQSKPVAAANSCPTYDPKTGKRIRAENQPTQNTFLGAKPEMQPKTDANQVLEKSRQMQPHNMLEFSPLSGFTKNELQSMGKEVDDACSEGDAMSTGNTDSESDIDVEEIADDVKVDKKRERDSSSDESINDDCPKGWAKNKRQKRPLDNVYNLEEGNESTTDSYDFEKMRRIEGEDSTDEESIGSVDEEMALAVEREFLS